MSTLASFCYDQELEKNPELKDSDIKTLRQWSEQQPHLPKITDSTFAVFLHKNAYNVDDTKTNIDNYYTLRTHLPEFFSNRDTIKDQELRNIFQLIYIVPLEQASKEGHGIIIAKVQDPSLEKFTFNGYVKFLLLTIDQWLHDKGLVKGYEFIIDCGEATLGHTARLNPVTFKKYVCYLQSGLPVGLKRLHCININRAADALLNISRPLMKKEMLEILHVHPTKESLSKFIHIDSLPNESGGKAGRIMDIHTAHIKNLEENRNRILEEELRSRVDESKRPGKPKTDVDLFGIESNFQKLDLD